MNALVKSQCRAVERLQAETTSNIGRLAEALGTHSLQHAERTHDRRAIGQRQALLGGERHRLQAGAPQRRSAWENFTCVLRFTHANEGQAHVREWRQITAGAERTLVWNDRMHAAVEHLQQQVQRADANPRIPTRQGVGTDKHNGTRSRYVKRLPYSHRMTAENVALE